MSERTLVPILVFWAFLTVITPTLILLSENSKLDLDLHGNVTEGVKDRRMMGYIENHITKTTPTVTVESAEELAPAPAPAPSLGTGRANLRGSGHNHTRRSNRRDDGLRLLSPKKHLRQTKIRSTSS